MDLFLTPASISYLAQTIIFLVITIFLVFLTARSKAIFWLAGFFAMFVFVSLTSFVAVSSLDWFVYGWHIHNTLILVAMPLLLQFVYNFPSQKANRTKEMAIVTVLSLVFMVLGIAITLIHIFSIKVYDLYPYLPVVLQGIEILELAWAAIVLLKLTVKISTNSEKESWLKRLRTPKGRAARATRGFSFSLLGMLFFWIVSVVLGVIGYRNITIFVFTIATTWALVIFIIVLINQTKNKAGILVKLVGLILVTTFTGITLAAWLSAPTATANYQAANTIPDRQTLHFEQNNANFSITRVDFAYDDQFGRKLIFDGEDFASVKLLTSFAYAGENWDEIQVSPKGFVVFGKENAVQANLDTRTPAIAAFYVQDMVNGENGSVFAHITEEAATITWYLLPRADQSDASITSQLSLQQDGSFDITYNGIRTNFQYDPYDILDMEQVTGFFMGENDKRPTRIHFGNDLPYVSNSWNGVYDDYYVDFREHLHQNMVMQLYAFLFTLIALMIVMPIFFNRSFSKPFNQLKEGFERVRQGDFDVWLDPINQDDIGQFTKGFNQMVDSLANNRSKYSQGSKELQVRLIQRNKELQESVDKLAYEIERRKSMQKQIEMLRDENLLLSVRDEMTGCYNRVHFLAMSDDEAKRAKRYGHPLSFAIVDPDYLRMVNETYGTATGDELLKSLAKALDETLRETDSFGRIGGEEFGVLMPETNGEDALAAAHRWRTKIGSLSLKTSKGPLRVSVSVGVVQMPEEGIKSIDLLVHHANQALDAAKSQGRNTAVLWSPELDQ